MAKCSRGTPRVANRLLKRARDFAAVLGDGVIDESIAREALQRMGIDDTGLDEMDRGLLRAIIEMYGGGPVGLETIAAALGEEAVTLEDVCEPYLMQLGYLTRTPRGRCVTRYAYEMCIRDSAYCAPKKQRRNCSGAVLVRIYAFFAQPIFLPPLVAFMRRSWFKIRLRIRMLLGVTSRSSSGFRNSRLSSKLNLDTGTRRSASSLPEARVLERCLVLHTLTVMSSPAGLYPTCLLYTSRCV